MYTFLQRSKECKQFQKYSAIFLFFADVTGVAKDFDDVTGVVKIFADVTAITFDDVTTIVPEIFFDDVTANRSPTQGGRRRRLN